MGAKGRLNPGAAVDELPDPRYERTARLGRPLGRDARLWPQVRRGAPFLPGGHFFRLAAGIPDANRDHTRLRRGGGASAVERLPRSRAIPPSGAPAGGNDALPGGAGRTLGPEVG